MKRTLSISILALLLVAAGFLFVPAARTAAAADETEKKHDATFEVYKDKGGEYRWRLRTTNSQVIATSGQGYSSKQSCEDGIASVKKNAPDAAVEEKSGDEAPAKE